MLTDYVIPGDKLELTELKSKERVTADGVVERKTYATRIYDVVSDDEIKVNMPMENGHLVLLPVDGEYDICFYTKNGLYQCYCRVLDRYKASNIYILTLELTSALRKFQRREYYRLNCVLNMKCREVGEEEYKQVTQMEDVQFVNTDLTLQDGIIVDISGGGARFISDVQYENDTKILFKFSLASPGHEPREYEIIGKLLRSEKIEGRDHSWQNHVQFINMDMKERESIIRYIFEEERRLRKKQKDL